MLCWVAVRRLSLRERLVALVKGNWREALWGMRTEILGPASRVEVGDTLTFHVNGEIPPTFLAGHPEKEH